MKIDILTSNGTPIELIRFFQSGDKQYLIYSDDNNIPDEQGHVIIRVAEIGNSGKISANAVDDLDWGNVTTIIKNIVNANRNNQGLPIRDLDYNVLEGIEIFGSKALKLMPKYVEFLKQNQPYFEQKKLENIVKNNDEMATNSINVDTISNVDNYNNDLSSSTEGAIEIPNALVDGATQQQNTMENNQILNEANPIVDDNDYQRLYKDQVELVKQLKSEIEIYRNKLEMLKSIINN